VGCDHECSAPCGCRCEEEFEDLPGVSVIQRRCGLVGEDEARIVDQRPSDSHPLRLSVTELERTRSGSLPEADAREKPQEMFVGDALADYERCEAKIVEDRESSHQVQGLVNEADASSAQHVPAALGQSPELLAIHDDAAGVRRAEARENMQKGRLTAA